MRATENRVPTKDGLRDLKPGVLDLFILALRRQGVVPVDGRIPVGVKGPEILDGYDEVERRFASALKLRRGSDRLRDRKPGTPAARTAQKAAARAEFEADRLLHGFAMVAWVEEAHRTGDPDDRVRSHRLIQEFRHRGSDARVNGARGGRTGGGKVKRPHNALFLRAWGALRRPKTFAAFLDMLRDPRAVEELVYADLIKPLPIETEIDVDDDATGGKITVTYTPEYTDRQQRIRPGWDGTVALAFRSVKKALGLKHQ
jgi:hypothetical protein